MIRPILLTVSLLLAAVSGWAKTDHQAKMMANLLKRCEDGIAVACYDYGITLSSHRKKPADVKRGKRYIRRACALAYSPACAPRSVVAEKKVKDRPPEIEANESAKPSPEEAPP